MEEDEILAKAIELAPEARASFLKQECCGNAEQQSRIVSLLRHVESPDSFLSGAPMNIESTDAFNHSEKLADERTIGPYKLREQIGEGGMGVVYVAEQSKPVRRKVALKVIKPGMDSKEVVARFEAERQALAMMDHPSIAKVFDAGMTDTGRPYFAMELINGAPITKYCDEKKLSIRERLNLFTQVCNAIQHAHQKGVIHRDVKPSNVLVTLHDGRPVPVVIDFGVAKATNQSLTEQTIYTRLNQVVGTTLYMSPEQAELSRFGVDTRTDVYALGVLLYELLTGTTPFDQDRLSRAGFDEIRRIIREEEPPKPSTRVSSLGETASDVSIQRGTDPSKLTSSIRGDLDWIVMKALEKDRSRRYESASRFADDIENFLRDEVVEARPPSIANRFQKAWRRNRFLVSGAITATLVLTTGLGFAIWGIRERDKTLKKLQQVIVIRGVEESLLGEDIEPTLQLARDAGVGADWIETIHGARALHVGDNASSQMHFGNALEINENNVAAKCMLSIALYHDGRLVEHELLMQSFDKWQPRSKFQELDRLFLAYAKIYMDRETAADELRAILQAHPSWMFARAMLAGTLGEYATVTLKPEDARKAIAEATVPALAAPENPFVLMVQLYTHTVACELSPSPDLIEQGITIADKLSQYPDYLLGKSMRACFMDRFGNPGDAQQLNRELASEHGFFAVRSVGRLMRLGDDDFVRKLEPKSIDGKLARALLLTQLPGAEEEVSRVTDELMRSEYAQSRWGRENLLVLLLLSKKGELAKRKCGEWLAEISSDPTPRRFEANKQMFELFNQDLVKDQADMHFHIRKHIRFLRALDAYSRGDLDTAIEHIKQFNKVPNLSVWSFWGQALLQKWEESPKNEARARPITRGQSQHGQEQCATDRGFSRATELKCHHYTLRSETNLNGCPATTKLRTRADNRLNELVRTSKLADFGDKTGTELAI
ncbi:MAG TPA: hypothetical protein DDW52_14840 [Planctomycetaceae bacterium]|nr:hypothetical protein [Planctomycetaceae bacterium]